MMLLEDVKNRPKLVKYRKWNGIVEDAIQVGDRVRNWSPFLVTEEGMIMKWNEYYEGVVIKKVEIPTAYWLTIKKEKYVFNDIVKTSNFTFGDTTIANSRSELLELLTPQMELGVD